MNQNEFDKLVKEAQEMFGIKQKDVDEHLEKLVDLMSDLEKLRDELIDELEKKAGEEWDEDKKNPSPTEPTKAECDKCEPEKKSKFSADGTYDFYPHAMPSGYFDSEFNSIVIHFKDGHPINEEDVYVAVEKGKDSGTTAAAVLALALSIVMREMLVKADDGKDKELYNINYAAREIVEACDKALLASKLGNALLDIFLKDDKEEKE